MPSHTWTAKCTTSCGISVFHWTDWCKTSSSCSSAEYHDPWFGDSYYWDECDSYYCPAAADDDDGDDGYCASGCPEG